METVSFHSPFSLDAKDPPTGVTDVNDLPSGVWYCNSLTNNPSATIYIIQCMLYGTTRGIQLAFRVGSNAVYMRRLNTSQSVTSWAAWAQIL